VRIKRLENLRDCLIIFSRSSVAFPLSLWEALSLQCQICCREIPLGSCLGAFSGKGPFKTYRKAVFFVAKKNGVASVLFAPLSRDCP
jgi:hypothetical protein